MTELENKVVEAYPILKKIACKNYGDMAEDLVQAAVCKVLEKKTYVELPSSTFIYYMLIIMRNDYVNSFRSNLRRGNVRDFFGLIAGAVLSDSDQHNELELKDIYARINRLPPYKRDVILLRLKGYTYAEIAKLFKVPVGTIKGRIYITTQELKKDFIFKG